VPSATNSSATIPAMSSSTEAFRKRLDRLVASGQSLLCTRRSPRPGLNAPDSVDGQTYAGWRAQAEAALVETFGEQHAYAKAFNGAGSKAHHHVAENQIGVLKGIREAIDHGELAIGGLTLRRQAEADVLGDLFDQADVILDGHDFHPAAAVVLIGGALEEFLRSWVDEKSVSPPGTKRSIDAYAGALRGAGLLDKNDKKDIDSWAGQRNDAAHGEFDKLSKERARIMLDGVRLFFRKHGADRA
jgi:hypothetical protein